MIIMQSMSQRATYKLFILIFLISQPFLLPAQFFAGITTNAGSNFERQGVNVYGIGLNISTGYSVNDWLETDIQAQHYWLSSTSGKYLSSISLNTKFIPFSSTIKPYISLAGGIGKLYGKTLIFDGGSESVQLEYDTWLLKPKIGIHADTGFLDGLEFDFGFFYELNKYQSENLRINLFGANLGLRYKFGK